MTSTASESDLVHIIEATAEITDRLVIVSTSDTSEIITNIGFGITDHGNVSKIGKARFARKVWIGEKNM